MARLSGIAPVIPPRSTRRPYLTGSFVITSLEHASPAGDDTTWNATFDNDGAPEIDETKFDITRVTSSN